MTPRRLKLSICIGTFNRAAFIGEALESIIAQATSECEIVVSDNASTDDTERVVMEYARRFDQLRYVKQNTNRGYDRNFDLVVELARGEYCWLFSDDDVMKPGAIAAVLDALRRDYSLILVNGEHKDVTMSKVQIPNFFGITSNRTYAPGDIDHLFTEMGTCLMCVCCVVIKREIWLARERQQYYDSWFIHMAVVLQKPLPGETLVLAKPFMSLRLGNRQTVKPEAFRVMFISWPSLIWSFPLSESTKRRFGSAHPWRETRYLLAFRMMGRYSLGDFRRWIRPRLHSFREMLTPILIALLPPKLALHLLAFYSDSPYEAVLAMFPKSLKPVLGYRASQRNLRVS